MSSDVCVCSQCVACIRLPDGSDYQKTFQLFGTIDPSACKHTSNPYKIQITLKVRLGEFVCFAPCCLLFVPLYAHCGLFLVVLCLCALSVACFGSPMRCFMQKRQAGEWDSLEKPSIAKEGVQKRDNIGSSDSGVWGRVSFVVYAFVVTLSIGVTLLSFVYFAA